MILSVSSLCTIWSISPRTVICKETCMFSATVRGILTDLASCWIQGTVHSYTELSGIQHFIREESNLIFLNTEFVFVYFWSQRIWKQFQKKKVFKLDNLNFAFIEICIVMRKGWGRGVQLLFISLHYNINTNILYCLFNPVYLSVYKSIYISIYLSVTTLRLDP